MKMYIIVEDTGLGKSFTSVFVNGYGYPNSEIFFDEESAKKEFKYQKSKGRKVKLVAFNCEILAEN